MSIIGKVDSLWRYPVKSMRGQELDEAFAGFSGVYGDRFFAFKSSESPKGFPYLTAREQRRLLQYRPHFRNPDKSARQLGEETGMQLDKRRFRANVYVDLTSAQGFAENEFVGRSLRIGPKVMVTILERDPRCVMITLDPDTGEKTPAILKKVAQAHEGMAGVYGAVMVEGMLHKGDPVEVLD